MKSFLSFLLLFGVVSCADKDYRCDYTYINEVNGWMKYHPIPATWSDARLRCHLEGAVLASPLDYDLQNAILKVAARKDIFTGFHATFSKEDYFSVEGIQLGPFTPWATGEPDNWQNSEDCLYMTPNGTLGDMNCKLTRSYVCYKKFNDNDRINQCGTIDNEYHFYNSTGSCYKFHRVPRTWSRAFMACAAEGGHLAIINSKTEAKVIEDIFSKNPPRSMPGIQYQELAFIGFHDWGERGEFLTIQGQTLKEAGYDQFAVNQPNNVTTGQFCGSVYRPGTLNDMWCEISSAFICEKKPESLLC